jgi:hypothetical protein
MFGERKRDIASMRAFLRESAAAGGGVALAPWPAASVAGGGFCASGAGYCCPSAVLAVAVATARPFIKSRRFMRKSYEDR